ncbi:MAG: hypothetical protein ACXABI_07545 [Candidatus Hodarchaeales archaeon]
MISFKEFRKECIFRSTKICTYWEKTTQCHLLACPFYSNNVTQKKRISLNKRVQDTVTFQPSDFDRKRNSVLDLIDDSKTERISDVDRFRDSPKSSIVTKNKVSRLVCLACGEHIDDDKFTTVRDPHGIVIYLHSKGKCSPRREQLSIVRERWLKMHRSGEKVDIK